MNADLHAAFSPKRAGQSLSFAAKRIPLNRPSVDVRAISNCSRLPATGGFRPSKQPHVPKVNEDVPRKDRPSLCLA
jgi:hypothetical protein